MKKWPYTFLVVPFFYNTHILKGFYTNFLFQEIKNFFTSKKILYFLVIVFGTNGIKHKRTLNVNQSQNFHFIIGEMGNNIKIKKLFSSWNLCWMTHNFTYWSLVDNWLRISANLKSERVNHLVRQLLNTKLSWKILNSHQIGNERKLIKLYCMYCRISWRYEKLNEVKISMIVCNVL